MNDRAALGPFPFGDPLPGLLFILGDAAVVHRVEVAIVYRDALEGLRNLEFPDLLQSGCAVCSGRSGREEQNRA
jgi:hypothetical protein